MALNTAQELGRLTAQIEAMNARLDREYGERLRTDAEAAEARVIVRQALSDLEQGHKAIGGRLDQIEPVTRMVTGWRARWVGAMIVLGFLGTVAWTGVLFFKDSIIRIIQGA